MLIEKLNDPYNIEVLVSGDVADNHVCYFCEGKIPEGGDMFKVIYRHLNVRGGVDEATYFVDEDCMKSIRAKK